MLNKVISLSLAFFLGGVLLAGCGKDRQKTELSSLSNDELEILAGLQHEGAGSAQGTVEVIPVPSPPRTKDRSMTPPEAIFTDTVRIVPPSGAAAGTTATTAPSATPRTIRTGPSSDHTFEEKVQIALKAAGYYGGTVDGKVGRQTREGLRAFQKARGLKADGLAGPETWAVLKDFYYRGSE